MCNTFLLRTGELDHRIQFNHQLSSPPDKSTAHQMAARSRSFKRVLATVVMLLVSLASATVDPSIHQVSTTQGRSSQRVLLQRMDREAPRSFPPPKGNVFLNDPRNFGPPRRPFFDAPDGRPPARIPKNARRLVPPPHP